MKTKYFTIVAFIFITNIFSQASKCQPGYFEIEKSTTNEAKKNIDWCKIDTEFHLPKKFKIVFGIGPNYFNLDKAFIKNECNETDYTIRTPLEYGFSHIAIPNLDTKSDHYQMLSKEERALLFLNLRELQDSKWNKLSLPYCDNIDDFYIQWKKDLFVDDQPEVDLVVCDIERVFHSNVNNRIIDAIQNSKNDMDCELFEDTTDTQIVANYYKDMSTLYNRTISYPKNNLPNAKISSYSDTPILRTWWQISNLNWQNVINNFDVDTNKEVYNTLIQASNTASSSDFYSNQDFITPSTYNFYNYSGNYLAYLLFSVEANLAWASKNNQKKDVVPFTWMRYHDSSNKRLEFISNFMAEATSIFSIMAGANGIWQWDAIDHYGRTAAQSGRDELDLTNQMYFIRGLKRLSAFNSILETNYSTLNESNSNYVNPIRLFKENSPVWRGIINENKSEILIAAHNPFALDDEETKLNVSYEENGIKWSKEIILRGTEIFLDSFTINLDNESLSDVELLLLGGAPENYELNSDNTLKKWIDQSGNNRHAEILQKTNGKPIIDENFILNFSNNDTAINNDELVIKNPPIFLANQDWQAFFVCKTSHESWQQVLNFGKNNTSNTENSGSGWGIYASHSDKAFYYTHEENTGAKSPHFFSESKILNTGINLFSLQKNGNSYTWYLNGENVGSQTKTGTDVTLATGNTWTIADHFSSSFGGAIYAIAVFDKALNENKQKQIENFLMDNYNIKNCAKTKTEFTFLQSKIIENVTEQVIISPNPASDFITIQLNSLNTTKKLKVFNSLGKLIAVKTIKSDNSSCKLDTHNWNPGLYFIKFENQTESLKFILE